MMIQGFYTGVSGVKSSQYAIDVVADNLANVNTMGFRGYNAEFASLFEEKLNTTAGFSSPVDSGAGLGTRISAISMNEGIGSMLLTQRSTDLAILGDGWFGVEVAGAPLYTRDGSFMFDANGDLVTSDGYHVLGTIGNNIDGNILTEQLAEIKLADIKSQEKLQFPKDLYFPVQPTTITKLYGNLGTEDATRVISAKAIDAQSNNNSIRLEFKKSDPQILPGSQWDVEAVAQSLDGQTIYDTQSGVVSFDERGALISSTLSTINNNGSDVVLDFGTEFNGVTSIRNNTYYASSTSDGVQAGELVGYDINRNGEVIAAFTNGMQSSVATLAVYHFQNDRGLDRVGSNRFSESSNSGEAIFFKDANGNNIKGSDVSNYRLENSNVTLDVALTELIILQRSYDANSKSISTADEMMQKALSMDA